MQLTRTWVRASKRCSGARLATAEIELCVALRPAQLPERVEGTYRPSAHLAQATQLTRKNADKIAPRRLSTLGTVYASDCGDHTPTNA